MLKRLALLSALAISSIPVAHATPITGTINVSGDDSFTSSSITFYDDSQTRIGGTSTLTMSAFTGGNLVTMFPGYETLSPAGCVSLTPPPAGCDPAGPLPFAPGFQTVISRLGVTSVLALTATEAGETLDFFMTDYTTAYFPSGSGGCNVFACLNVSGDGYFTETGTTNYDQTPGIFTFTTQETSNGAETTFSASGTATPTPEPGSLLLLGTGLLGIAGVARRKLVRA